MPKRRPIWRWTRRILIVSLILNGVLVIIGVTYQAIATAIDARKFQPPGQLVDVGGYRLHINCIGEGTPTVVMESGCGGSSLDWCFVQPAVAQFTRACTYDRAGYGWSDPGPTPRVGQRVVSELHALLTKAGIEGPYVLVGHSLGGLYIRLYASQYPDEAAGMVLVDTTHEDLISRLSSNERRLQAAFVWLVRLTRITAPLGIPRLFGRSAFLMEVPEQIKPMADAVGFRSKAYSAMFEEIAAMRLIMAEVGSARARDPRPDWPLVVLTQGFAHLNSLNLPSDSPDMRLPKVLMELQTDLTRLSSNSTHIIAKKSNHYIHLDQPDLVIDAIRRVVESVRENSSLAQKAGSGRHLD